MNEELASVRRLVAALFGALKLMRMYGTEHDATADALLNLSNAIAGAAVDGQVEIAVRGNRVRVNGTTARASICGNTALSFIAQEWGQRDLASVRFQAAIDPEDLGAFATAFLDLDLSRSGRVSRLVAGCAAAGCRGIAIEEREEGDEAPVLLDERRESAMRAYLRGLRALQAALGVEGLHQDPSKLRRVRRAIQNIVDSFLDDESELLSLVNVDERDTEMSHHSLRVGIYALLLGRRLGMSRRQLGELGLASFLHDVGKACCALRVNEHRHAGRGARLLLSLSPGHEGMLKAAIAAYEHHLRLDKIEPGQEPHLFSRIVTIADCYDALTAQGGFRKVPYGSYNVLSFMHDRAGVQFDPLLLKVFARGLGVYPVGTRVRLTTGEVAVVAGGPQDANRPDRPPVRIVETADGSLPQEEVIDLARDDQRQIARPLPWISAGAAGTADS